LKWQIKERKHKRATPDTLPAVPKETAKRLNKTCRIKDWTTKTIRPKINPVQVKNQAKNKFRSKVSTAGILAGCFEPRPALTRWQDANGTAAKTDGDPFFKQIEKLAGIER
jgi:hypothetical protein